MLKRKAVTESDADAPILPRRDPYATQVIKRRHVATLYRVIVYLFLLLSFALSILGNVRMFGGDVAQLVKGNALYVPYARSGSFLGSLAAAAVYQLVIQVFQFRFAIDRRYWRQYLALIGLSTVPSLWTFAPLLQWLALTYRLGIIPVYAGALLLLGLNDFLQERALQE